MKIQFFLGLSFLYSIGLAQPANDNCSNAVELCPGVTLSGTTTDATADAASDHAFCYTPSSTVWFKFTTNDVGGNVDINFSNLVIDPTPTLGQDLQAIIYAVGTDCDQLTYSIFSACGNSSGADFTVSTALACDPNTTYFVQVNGSNVGTGVTDPASVNFDINASGPGIDKTYPTVSLSAGDVDLCQGDDEPLNLTITDCDDTVRIDWYYEGDLLLSTTEDTFSTALLPDTGELQVIVFCDEVCNISDTSNAILFNVTPIEANAGPDKFIKEGDQVTIEGSGSGDPEWTPSSYLSNTTSFQPISSPPEDQTYFLTVTNGACSATDEMTVYVGEVIQIYHAFTPNGDNVNDKWIIGNSSQFPNMEVNIYDRSGQRVFSATNYDSPDQWWDGTFKGKDLPVSAYYYVIDLKDTGTDDDIYKGVVTIIR